MVPNRIDFLWFDANGNSSRHPIPSYTTKVAFVYADNQFVSDHEVGDDGAGLLEANRALDAALASRGRQP